MQKFTLTMMAIALVASPASAQQHSDEPLVRVTVADLDLASVEGQRILTRRIGRATELACGSYAGMHHYDEVDPIDRCRRRARAEVERQVAAIERQQSTSLAAR